MFMVLEEHKKIVKMLKFRLMPSRELFHECRICLFANISDFQDRRSKKKENLKPALVTNLNDPPMDVDCSDCNLTLVLP